MATPPCFSFSLTFYSSTILCIIFEGVIFVIIFRATDQQTKKKTKFEFVLEKCSLHPLSFRIIYVLIFKDYNNEIVFQKNPLGDTRTWLTIGKIFVRLKSSIFKLFCVVSIYIFFSKTRLSRKRDLV